jgi:phage terminase large subunit
MIYKPEYFQRQIEALEHLSTDSIVEQVLYGGAAGGGKTKLGCMWQIQRRLKYAGTRSVIGRSKLDTLKKTTLKTFFETAKDMNLINGFHYFFNGSSNTIRFFNGSEIILKDLFDYPSDVNWDSLGSLEITDYFCDEVAEITEKAVNILHSRCRFKLKEFGLIPKGFLSCNPSKGWLYNEFYLRHKNNELPEHRAFVQALPQDNPHLPEAYLISLSRLPEYDRKRLLEGNWDFDDDTDKLFATDNLARCFRTEIVGNGKKYITADIARYGKDRTIICIWEGLTIIRIHELRRANLQEVGEKIRALQNEHGISLNNILADEDGIGGGLIDLYKYRGFVNGSRPKNSMYQNLKTECYYKLANFIEEGKLTIMDYTYKEQIMKELEMIKRHRSNSDGKLQVTPKDVIKQMTGTSPDLADAIMMRMFFELNPSLGVYAYA